MPSGPYEATRWIQCVFASELSFILHLPVLIIPEWVDAPPDTSTKRRLKFEEYPSSRTNYNFALLQTIIAVVRILLHVAIFVLVWIPVRNVTLAANPYEDRATSVYIGEAFTALRDSELATVAGFLLLVSTVLWFLAYIHFRAHFARLERDEHVLIPEDLYFFCHIGVINFVLDIPDYNVGTNWYIRVGLIICTLIAGSILVLAIFLERPVILCWGCYPESTTLSGFVYGPCIQDLQGHGGLGLGLACDQPGILCGDQSFRWKQVYAQDIHVAGTVLVAAAVVYLFFAFRPRIEYFSIKSIEVHRPADTETVKTWE